MKKKVGKKYKKKTSHQETLSLELKKQLYELAEEGRKLTLKEQYTEAIEVWKKAIELIPEPRQNYFETANFMEGIAYNYQMMHQYPQALKVKEKALGIWGEKADSQPFILRDLGEIYYELGEMERAADYLKRAYLLEGAEIFEADVYGKIDHNKYFKFLKKNCPDMMDTL